MNTLNLQNLLSKRVHFIGLGGAGMSGIARIMLAHGISVSGSDAKDSATLSGLQTLGAKVFVGHSANQIVGAEVLVVSSAVLASNPEFVAAKAAGLIILTRAQTLAILMSESKAIAVAGTHGKTTTTSMLTVALQGAGLDPSFAIGGMINRSGTNSHLGTGKIFVAEADESDGSFLAYRPFGAIITNIELDHVDHFPDLESVLSLFEEFVASIQSGGFLVLGVASPGVVELISRVKRDDISLVTYGAEADFSLSHIGLAATNVNARVTRKGKVMGELELAIPGAHNLDNALAAYAAGLAVGADSIALLKGLSTFTGARRRFENRGSVNEITVIDDYGHHPTELQVTLETARRFAKNGRVITIFQPHRFSRTARFASDFAESLKLADQVYLLEIYSAGEAPIPGVSSLLIAQKLVTDGAALVQYEPSMIEVANQVINSAKPGDVIVLLGAGDVNSLAPVILDGLAERFI
jgi:UDP-N-acetylmuramate--alanine ligase